MLLFWSCLCSHLIHSIPLAIENTALLAAFIHPNHIVYRGSLGFSRLPPPRDSNGFGYIALLVDGVRQWWTLNPVISWVCIVVWDVVGCYKTLKWCPEQAPYFIIKHLFFKYIIKLIYWSYPVNIPQKNQRHLSVVSMTFHFILRTNFVF